jgi:hypothetical protein
MSIEKLAASRILRPVRSMNKGSNERWFEYYRTTGSGANTPKRL